jgi:DinB family protein
MSEANETLFAPTLRALEGVVERTEREPPVTACRADGSGWSVGEHLAHVSLANRSMAAAVKSILVGGPEVEIGGRVSEIARTILATGEIPRGIADAPAGTEPGDERTHEALHELVSQARSDFRRLAAMEEPILAVPGTVAHPLLGPFSASQWVRFCGIHTRHHLAIVDEMLS